MCSVLFWTKTIGDQTLNYYDLRHKLSAVSFSSQFKYVIRFWNLRVLFRAPLTRWLAVAYRGVWRCRHEFFGALQYLIAPKMTLASMFLCFCLHHFGRKYFAVALSSISEEPLCILFCESRFSKYGGNHRSSLPSPQAPTLLLACFSHTGLDHAISQQAPEVGLTHTHASDKHRASQNWMRKLHNRTHCTVFNLVVWSNTLLGVSCLPLLR